MSVAIPLVDLLQDFPQIQLHSSCMITSLTQDSRQICPGALFFAVPGLHQDGRDFIGPVLAQGASAILYENNDGFQPDEKFKAAGKILLGFSHLNDHIGIIAARFYHNPSQKMTMIGVTGTNGKTSITQFIAEILNKRGQTCAVVGSLGDGIPPKLKTTGFTTPDAISLQKDLARCLSQGSQAVAMEVTSHSLAQRRVAGIKFDVAVFTNLTRDHLNYHKTMQEYGAAKARLFQCPTLKTCIYNADDDFGLQLLSRHLRQAQALVYSINPNLRVDCAAVITGEIIRYSQGFRIHVRTPWGEGQFNTNLMCRFNASNLLAVLCVLGALNIPLVENLAMLEQLKPVIGRMQCFGGDSGKPLVVVDYAHTPDALKQVLLSLRERKPRKLWCVFGCDGNRDRGKRPQMGVIAEAHSDYNIITSTNPCDENPLNIIEEIKNGMRAPHLAHFELDRDTAIAHAINNAAQNDIVLVAGMGHETEQIYADGPVHQCDITTVQQLLALRR